MTQFPRVNSSDDLEVYEEVGRGGFGVVYRGIIRSTQQEVAIKQIDLEKDSTDLLEINKEIQIISECRCKQITSYIGSFVKNYKLWVIMEFIDGGSIFELLKPGPIVDENVISYIMEEILNAKHGDIKLTDFGVSTQLSSNFSKRNTTVGTPYWMAPEVIVNNNGGHSYKADIWSLGCTSIDFKCQKNQDFVKLINLSSLQVSSDLRDFLSCCFIEDPKARYSAGKLLKHRFITKYSSNALIKKLITKKQLWNQQNHIVKTQNYYVPTEIHNNQIKWSMIDDDDDEEGNDENNNANQQEISQLSAQLDKQLDPLSFMKADFNTILTKIFNKLDHKNLLSNKQYDQIQEMNNIMINLVSHDSDSRRVLIFQYLKYLIKELLKEKNGHISRLVLPSNIVRSTPSPSHATGTFSSTTGGTSTTDGITLTRMGSRKEFPKSKFDEIESSLLDSWINRMEQDK
ncbi:Serine/threonine-protein kinase svkA [Candida viswanathii]|uniref:non-specific serine/threonine protein kinase n=1 Tax=Candida viswanathii TaxID=5486 RepID=A0A367XXI8_9ASCO|nr:Serine/threonine-protein kinase svkA [Candida viswanathii]